MMASWIVTPQRHSLRSACLVALVALFGSLGLAAADFTLPASWAYPLDSEDAASPGFAGKTHQARANANLSATIKLGDAQLNDELTDPITDLPYENLTVRKSDTVTQWLGYQRLEEDFTFVLTNMVNFAIDSADGNYLDVGNFDANLGYDYFDYQPPGLPGRKQADTEDFTNAGNFAVAFSGFIQLSAGTHILGIRCNDAYQLAFHPNDGRDLFRSQALGFDSNRGVTDQTVEIEVEQDGIYAMRIMQNTFTTPSVSEFEFYTVNPSDPLDLTLVNDRTAAKEAVSVKAWHKLSSPSRPYINRVSPVVGASGVEQNTPIEVILFNVGATDTLDLSVNGSPVTPTRVDAGNQTTLTYTPGALPSGSSVNVELSYAGAVSSWEFVMKSGRKALMVTGGGTLNSADGFVSDRLATQYGLDVLVKSEASVVVDDATDAVLILFSSTLNAGSNPLNDTDRNFKALEIPIINWEQGYGDDLRIQSGGGGNQGNQTDLAIVGAGHPLTGGLADGQYTIATAGLQYHYLPPAEGVILIANDLTGRGLVFGVAPNTTVISSNGEFTHPAGRVHLGFMANDGANQLTAEGLALFDAAVNWLVPAAPAEPEMTLQQNGDGTVTLSWTESGTLEEKAAVDDAWQTSDKTNGQTFPIPATGNMFYQVRQ